MCFYIADKFSGIDNDAVAEDLVGTLQVLEVTSPAIHKSLLSQVSYYYILINNCKLVINIKYINIINK